MTNDLFHRYVTAWDTAPEGRVHDPKDFDRLENGGMRKYLYPVALAILSLLKGCPANADVSVPDILRYKLDSLEIENLNRPRPFRNSAIV